MQARWPLPAPDGALAERLAAELALEPLVSRILAQRGFEDAAAVRAFLAPSLSGLHSPWLLADIETAVARIRAAIEHREAILLYGDYDVDGTTAIVLLKKVIELLGGQARFHVPHRLREGYGLRADVVERAAAAGVRLIISVDTGVRASQVVDFARSLGVDVIVTDHHLPEAQLPPALAVLNPNRPDCPYPEKQLCGAGVAFKLAQALLERSGLPAARVSALTDSLLKLVAIATIADVVTLTGENRIIAKRGLAGLRRVHNHGLRALLGVAGLSATAGITAQEIAFRVAPRINAAGRMADARDIIDLFVTGDEQRAAELARQLDGLNHERQEAEAAMIASILEQCEQSPPDANCRALVFAEDHWHLGVAGIVASRLAERFARPVFVLSNAAEPGHLAGSGRSVPGFHLLAALETMPELFVRFGGHRQAAGLTLARQNLPEFRERFNQYARTVLRAEDLCPVLPIDAVCSLRELTERAASQIFRMEPFGFGNAPPLLATMGATVAGTARSLGSEKHLSVPVTESGRMLTMKAWRFGEFAHELQPGRRIDIAYQIERDSWSEQQGLSSWCATLKGFRPSSALA